MGYVRPATHEDATWLAPRLRQADLAEIQAASGGDPEWVLTWSLDASTPAMAIVGDDGDVIGLAGVVPCAYPEGAVWMMASDGLVKHRHQFRAESWDWVDRLNRLYPLLFNYVDARNTVHLRWLRWCGFTFIKLHPAWGVECRPFYEFVRIAHV